MMSRVKADVFRRTFSTDGINYVPPLIRIANGTFYRHHPQSTRLSQNVNPPLFENLDFELQSSIDKGIRWAIVGPSCSGKTTFLQALQGRHICLPPTARSYPCLGDNGTEQNRKCQPSDIILVDFGEEKRNEAFMPQNSYLSSRYESHRDESDFSLLDYLQNAASRFDSNSNSNLKIQNIKIWDFLLQNLDLSNLLLLPFSSLSNGQKKRATIARAFLKRPKILLLDEPFNGLDPLTLFYLSNTLNDLAKAINLPLVLSMRQQDPIPSWIDHILYLTDNCKVEAKETKSGISSLLEAHRHQGEINHTKFEKSRSKPIKNEIKKQEEHEFFRAADHNSNTTEVGKLGRDIPPELSEPIVEMSGIHVKYGNKIVLGNWAQNTEENSPASSEHRGLWWTVRRGERWGIFGPNGSGKTTLLSLVCSEHPQTYALPISLFGQSRLAEPGKPVVSIFHLRARIGCSSPEIHEIFPRSLSLRQVLESAWSDTLLGSQKLSKVASHKIDTCLRLFLQELRPDIVTIHDYSHNYASLKWAERSSFGTLSYSSQKVALFLRAIIKSPDIVILDEAFSGMDGIVRDKCELFLEHGDRSIVMTKNPESNSKHVSCLEHERFTESATISGLSKDQVLLCVSHVKEEVPKIVKNWIYLPESNTGQQARFGRLECPLRDDPKRWNDIWGI